MPSDTTTYKGKPFGTISSSSSEHKYFYAPSFDIYGGVAGLYDYGPPGSALTDNIVDIWREHFVLHEEDMLKVEPTILTTHDVLKTSGHVDKFADWMCKDPKTGEIFRADHLVEEVLEARLKGDKEARGEKVEPKKKKKKVKNIAAVKLEDSMVKEIEEVLAKIDNYNGEELGLLMKKYDIEPRHQRRTATPCCIQSHVPNLHRPLDSNLPAYLRPETAQGQFVNFQKLLDHDMQQMPFASAVCYVCESSSSLKIEHFVDPEGGKKHPRFDEVKDVELLNNETLGYFLARIQLFLLKLGVDPKKIRFRQHMANEMAHYAADCWDAELLTSYGWIECVGCADRSAYDLSVHMKKTGAPLIVRETRKEPLKVEEFVCELDKKKFGPKFKKDGKTVEAAIEALSQDLREKLSLDLEKEGKIVIDVPEVGDGKALCEHVYWTREQDEARAVLSFPPAVAPTKVLIDKLRKLGISNRVDASGASIGKRYARNDELGPFKLRRDIAQAISNIVKGEETWSDVAARLPKFEGQNEPIRKLQPNNSGNLRGDWYERTAPQTASEPAYTIPYSTNSEQGAFTSDSLVDDLLGPARTAGSDSMAAPVKPRAQNSVLGANVTPTGSCFLGTP
ncbi:unnamed protein product [Alternaria alternata]